MKFRKPNGDVCGAVIGEGIRGGIVIQMDEQSTGIKDVKDLDKVIQSPLNLNDFDIIEATERERQLLRGAGYTSKGL
jgi:hypothetical protein